VLESPAARSVPELMMHIRGADIRTRRLAFSITLGNRKTAAPGRRGGRPPSPAVYTVHRTLQGERCRTCTTRQPAASRSATSPRSASASWKACVRRDTSLRGNDQFRMVTGPAQLYGQPSEAST
jgi:hypothetical protein